MGALTLKTRNVGRGDPYLVLASAKDSVQDGSHPRGGTRPGNGLATDRAATLRDVTIVTDWWDREADWEEQRRWSEGRAARLAVRLEEQRALHEVDQLKHGLYLAPTDDEFPDESFTAGWSQEKGA